MFPLGENWLMCQHAVAGVNVGVSYAFCLYKSVLIHDSLCLELRSTSRASLAAQLVKNLPAMRETWVSSLSWEDSLEKQNATHSSILA